MKRRISRLEAREPSRGIWHCLVKAGERDVTNPVYQAPEVFAASAPPVDSPLPDGNRENTAETDLAFEEEDAARFP
jgi:hypothetical protein